MIPRNWCVAVSRWTLPVLTVLFLVPGFAGVASAQSSSVAGVLTDAPTDSLLILLPARPEATVRSDLSAAEAAGSNAALDLVAAQGRLAEVKAHIEVRKGEIKTIEAKVDLAKQQKNQTEQANQEQQKKLKELQLKVLEARKEMREAEVNLANARKKAAETQAGLFKKELELLGKRNDQLKMSSAAEGTPNLEGLLRLQIEIRDLERRGLENQKDVADKEKSVAESAMSLLEKRLKVQEAQLALLAGPKK